LVLAMPQTVTMFFGDEEQIWEEEKAIKMESWKIVSVEIMGGFYQGYNNVCLKAHSWPLAKTYLLK